MQLALIRSILARHTYHAIFRYVVLCVQCVVARGNRTSYRGVCETICKAKLYILRGVQTGFRAMGYYVSILPKPSEFLVDHTHCIALCLMQL